MHQDDWHKLWLYSNVYKMHYVYVVLWRYSLAVWLFVTGYTQQYTGPGMSAYNTRQESSTTLVQPSGRYEREVKQATYSIQSTDSKYIVSYLELEINSQNI